MIFSSSVLLDTTFSRLVFFVTVTCPCSSTTKCHVNFFVYNNNNNNNNNLTEGRQMKLFVLLFDRRSADEVDCVVI